MLSGILPKRFGGRNASPTTTVIQTVEPLSELLSQTRSQSNVNNVTGLHPGVYGDFVNLSGDVQGLFGLVSPALHGDATGVIGRVDHLCGDIAYLARRVSTPSLV